MKEALFYEILDGLSNTFHCLSWVEQSERLLFLVQLLSWEVSWLQTDTLNEIQEQDQSDSPISTNRLRTFKAVFAEVSM